MVLKNFATIFIKNMLNLLTVFKFFKITSLEAMLCPFSLNLSLEQVAMLECSENTLFFLG